VRRLTLALIASAIAMVLLVPSTSAAACSFQLGFKMIRDQIPQTVGDCLVDEHFNPENGDSLQETTRGLLVWRKADNFTAFTDGYRSWVNGPFGLQQRLNTERFPWEPVAPPRPAPPAATATGPTAPAATPTGPTAPAATVTAPTAPTTVPTPVKPAATPVPPGNEPAPTINNPPDSLHVGEAAKLEWDWYRGLASNEEFVLHVEPTSPGLSKSWWIGTRDKAFFTPGDVLPPGRSIRWNIYVRVYQSEIMISQTSETRTIYRD
jgi:hypothetical protein